ncbi:MAG TPA: CHASE domain-containing protein, partial [bacterium]|nr:CHASE domain-containing protein [bacterium]
LADVRFIAKTPQGFAAKFIHSSSSRSGKLEFQLGADPFNQLAFEKAQDMAQVILTNKIDFTEGGRKQAGFLIIFPLYQNESPAGSIQERRQALLGFAVGVIRANDVFRSVAPGSHAIDYEIYDARELTREHLLYNDDRILAAQGRTLIADNDEALTARSEKSFSKDGALKVPGHMWTIHFSTRPKFFFNESRDHFLKHYLLSGMLLSLVVFGIVFFLNETCNTSSVL